MVGVNLHRMLNSFSCRVVKSLKITAEEKFDLRGALTGADKENFLREEIAQLKNENESLRKELKRKELILQRFEKCGRLEAKIAAVDLGL